MHWGYMTSDKKGGETKSHVASASHITWCAPKQYLHYQTRYNTMGAEYEHETKKGLNNNKNKIN